MWKPIINYENIYVINEYGEIKRIESNTIFLVHRLVAINFIKINVQRSSLSERVESQANGERKIPLL